ncbi:MAG: PHP domain-containing protein [Desulfobulbaceae bacterium]|nr:PHP domain-containing protein [Desulfobulbaceae bacterium]
MDYIDLHLHSSCSDGTMTPAELVLEAVKAGIKGIAITDHDTAEGIDEALQEGKRQGVEVLSGIEVSAYLDDIPMHILGYGFRHGDAALQQNLQKIQTARNERNNGILAKLNTLGIDATREDLRRYSRTGQTGRPHIARLLIEKKLVKTIDEAFYRYLRKGGLAYVERKRLMASDAIAMITAAGGIAVLAHPLTIDHTMLTLPAILREMKGIGLEGVEAYYPIYSATVRQKIMTLCQQMNLLITGGSDFHGAIRNGTSLAEINKKQRAPYELLVALKNHLSASVPTETAEILAS